MSSQFRSNGKLLLTGEYLVLWGARALAIPLRYGQSMQVKNRSNNGIFWESFFKGKKWFEAHFNRNFEVDHTNNPDRAKVILRILKEAHHITQYHENIFFNKQIITRLEFDPEWGWGSSSTLITNIANWLNIDPYTLSTRTLGGSNYDIACAQTNIPIFYRKYGNAFEIRPAFFNPSFKDDLYFIYLGAKQNSQKSAKEFLSKNTPSREYIDQISALSEKIAFTDDKNHFIELIDHHEHIVGTLLKKLPVKNELFDDFKGTVKSLGAWGGDFVMAVSKLNHKETLNYFSTKGYHVLFRFKEISLNKG